MTVTRNQLARGAADYVINEVASHVPDTGMRIAASALAYSLKNNPAILDRVLTGPAISMLLIPDESGAYDVAQALNSVRDAMSKYGNLTLTIPPIPLISKGEKTLSFSAPDVDKLLQYIERSDNA